MAIWKKNIDALKEVENFTVGNDRKTDLLLAPFDVLGSIAHVAMLANVGLIAEEEKKILIAELRNIHSQIAKNTFAIDENAEDVHSQIEYLLTQKLGDAGKKIHTARSRNDQSLLDIKLFLRGEIEKLVSDITSLFDLLQSKSEEYKNYFLPGYTHYQLAMPSSFGLWFGAYAESLVDDLLCLKSSFDVVNKNPLGSAAGFGSSFPINRTLTTTLLGFDEMNYNVVYAQMSRGKTEKIVATALASVADTLAKFSMDACLYLNQNFAFISFPSELTTGSSIMPHKKNPDVFEIIRSYCNQLKALPNEIAMMTTNLPSGYHRDLQLIKERIFPAFTILHNCIEMLQLMLQNISIDKNILDNKKYDLLFTVEEVNKLVMNGIPFREAYQIVGKQVDEKKYQPEKSTLHHTHEGSLGNLCNDKIKLQFDKIVSSFSFQKIKSAIDKLLNDKNL